MPSRRNPETIARQIRNHAYDNDSCFACGCSLTEDNRTREHVIPRWLQSELNLYDKQLTLVNGTHINYSQLTIPCCRECNNNRLGSLENTIQQAILNGVDAVKQLPKYDLFKWLAKIYLGMQYKELFLRAERSDPSLGSIWDSEYVKRFALIHFWLQAVAEDADASFCPGSLWIFKSQVPPDQEDQFDLIDDPTNGVLCIRIKDTVLCADFLDHEIHFNISNSTFTELYDIPLHPLQFKELAAFLIYAAKRIVLQGTISFWEVDGRLTYSIAHENTDFEQNPIRDGNIEDYAKVLAHTLQAPIEEILYGKVIRSFLRNPQGEFVYWPIGEPFPIPYKFPDEE